MSPLSLHMDRVEGRYDAIVARLPRSLRWFAMVLAPLWLAGAVFASGLVGVASSLIITVSISRVSSQGTPPTVALVLGCSLVAASGAYWMKERYESLLTIAVRQLAYRRFRRLFMSGRDDEELRQNSLTHPAQISQFAYVVDFLVSSLQIGGILLVTLWLYGQSGAFAIALISGLVIISVILINKVGRLWESYIALEGERRRWVTMIAQSLPRGSFAPTWPKALAALTGVREREEVLLRRRVRLQVSSGFLDRGALTAVLAAVVLVTAVYWPESSIGVGLILAARYFYGGVKNNLVNYRVIRLSLPMLRALDRAEASTQPAAVSPVDQVVERQEKLTSVDRDSELAQQIVAGPWPDGTAFLPKNPALHSPVLESLRLGLSPAAHMRFQDIAGALGLSGEVIHRLWSNERSLSSGERHRVVLALLLAEQPKWLILEDTFAALDPGSRTRAAHVIYEIGVPCTLISGSSEYVPAEFVTETRPAEARATASAPATVRDLATEPMDDEDGDVRDSLPDPAPGKRNFWSAVRLLFGARFGLMVFGAVMLTGAEVTFAAMVGSRGALPDGLAAVAAVSLVAIAAGTLIFYGVLYRTPIARLGALHRRIVDNLAAFARPANGGAVVGRLGEDFSELQMSVPGAIGSVFLVTIQTLLVVGAAAAGAPAYLLVVAAVVPLAYLAMRSGSRRILPASTEVANLRGEFIGTLSAIGGVRTSPISRAFEAAAFRAYEAAETSYLAGASALVRAYAYRTLLIQGLVLMLSLPAVALAAVPAALTSLVAASAIVYFALTLASGVQDTVETLHDAGVLGLTAERVRVLENFKLDEPSPPVRADLVDELAALIDGRAAAFIGFVGESGSGKSLTLDAMSYRYRSDGVTLVGSSDPFAESSAQSGEALACQAVAAAQQPDKRYVLLDETLAPLAPQREREVLQEIARLVQSQNKRVVVVLHSRTNLDVFDAVVNAGE